MGSIDQEIMISICKNGTYYNPANKHYNSTGNVMCDRCQSDPLVASIGWNNYDLCLKCVDIINTKVKEPVLFTTNMEQSQFKTFMKQNMVRRMSQRQYR
jgi:hypothetical protein